MLKKILQLLSVFTSVVLLMVLVVFLSFKLIFNEKKLNRSVANIIRGALYREFKTDSITFGLFEGIKIGKFTLSNKPDFSSGEFLRAKSLEVGFKAVPFFQRQLYIDRFILDSPQITIIKNKELTLLEKKLLKSKGSGSHKERKRKYSHRFFYISNIRIIDGSIIYRDEKDSKSNFDIKDINISSNDAGFLEPFMLDVSFGLKYMSGSADFEGNVIVDVKNKKMVLENSYINFKGSRNIVSGEIGDIDDKSKMNFNLLVESDKFLLSSLSELFNLDSNLKYIQFPGMKVRVTGTMDNIKLSFDLGKK